MTRETMYNVIEFIAANMPFNTGIIFFGGEPLLKKQLIAEALRRFQLVQDAQQTLYHFKMTTNGLLLDEEFLDMANKAGLGVSMSLDGIREAHDLHRVSAGNKSTFDIVEQKLELLLRFQPYAKVLITISPDTVEYYARSFEYLIGKGCRYIVASLDYSADWQDDDIQRLKKAYKVIAKLYEKYIYEERKFYFSPFDMKFTNHIKKENIECFNCHLGKKQISIAPNGDIYPCVQFVKDGVSNTAFKIGDVKTGFDEKKREELYKISKTENEACSRCAYNGRCNHTCSCLNWQLTGNISELSPKICESERALIEVADSLGETLYKKKAPMFIQKNYNAVYPIISMIEDKN
jgi:uncharacterized protein